MGERKACIFLVDDNAINLSTGKSALQNNFTVITIPSGELLLSVLKEVKPDLILLDVEMPGLSGFDAIKKIKANPATDNIPVIFLTGKDQVENEILGLSLGAVDYIAKPFSPPLLLKRVELHLLLQSQKNELRDFNSKLLDMVDERVHEVAALQDAVIVWAAEVLEFRDEETGQHIERVQKYLRLMVDEMQKRDSYKAELAKWDINAFLKSALLHDVGKIKIRDDILLKPGRLTEEETGIMRLHTIHGKALIESLQNKVRNQTFLDYAIVLALSHHERWDGTGYPYGLKGEEIPLQARMMAIADVYDALISERPYKKAFSHSEAAGIIKDGGGTQFDPELTDLFLSVSKSICKSSVNSL